MLVDESTGEVKWDVQAHPYVSAPRYGHTKIAMTPDGRRVASVGFNDEQWRLWEAASGTLNRVGARHDGTGACICVVPEAGPTLLHEGCPVVAHRGGLLALAFSPCGQRFATGGEDGAVILWDAQTGDAEHRIHQGTGAVTSITFSTDGELLASGTSDGDDGESQTICVWDATRALLRSLHREEAQPGWMHFSPTDSRRLASAGLDDDIHLWDVESGAHLRSMRGRRIAVFSPNGRFLATAGFTPQGFSDMHLVDAESGESRLRMVSHADKVLSAAFDEDGGKLASGSRDGTCKVWDSSTGALLRTIDIGNSVGSLVWGRDWERDEEDRQRAVAFAMGHDQRLGAGSRVVALEVGVVRMILDRVLGRV